MRSVILYYSEERTDGSALVPLAGGGALFVRAEVTCDDLDTALQRADPYPTETVLNSVPYPGLADDW